MIYNISYNDNNVRSKIENDIDKPLSLSQKLLIGGSGSPKLYITECSSEIKEYLNQDNNINSCIIEIRNGGIIVMFKSILETYALTIPYYKLNIYKGKSNEYSIYKDNYYVKILANTKTVHSFIKKIKNYKLKKTDLSSFN
tara:strand:- start:122644 stop:123066 length:423 start_codon:yes stop_codon:yes gene_type:complete